MNTTAQTGIRGEHAAAEYLREQGYMLCACNWRQGHYELDIVASKDDILHFVEVKTRREGSLTPPEAAITPQKFRALSRAAASYIARHRWQGEVQFDLVAVEISPTGECRVEFIENAMEYNW